MKTETLKIWMVTGKDHCGFSVRAKTAEEAVRRARRYRGFSRIERPILCVKLFYGKVEPCRENPQPDRRNPALCCRTYGR